VLYRFLGKYWLTSHVQSTHFPVQMMNTCISWTNKFYWYRRKPYTQLSSLYNTLSALPVERPRSKVCFAKKRWLFMYFTKNTTRTRRKI
jgi:hypothetical protein